MLLFCSKTTNFTYERGGVRGGGGGRQWSGKHEGRLARQKVPRKITHTSRVPQHWLIAFLRLSPPYRLPRPSPPLRHSFLTLGEVTAEFFARRTREKNIRRPRSRGWFRVLISRTGNIVRFWYCVIAVYCLNWTMFACDVNNVYIINNKFNATRFFYPSLFILLFFF